MEIALLGGTGDIGRGLALRFGLDTNHSVRIGSRDASKATRAASTYRERLSASGIEASIVGETNAQAAAAAAVIILAAPPVHVRGLVDDVADRLDDDAILVTPAVGMRRDDAGVRYDPPKTGSLTALVADHAPDDVSVVGAFHTLSANRLATLDDDLEFDTLVLGDDEAARTTVRDLANEIDGIRALDAGGTSNAAEVEALTPLLINVARENDELHDLGVRFV